LLTHLNSIAQKPARLVVIGSTGFIGGAITDLATTNGVETVELGSQDIDLRMKDAPHELASHIKKGDAVVAAAAVAPCKSIEDYQENLKIISSLEKAFCQNPPSYLLNISSDAVFADLNEPLTENSWKSPRTLHGLMHLTREVCIDFLDIPHAHLRPTLVYGKNDPHNGYGPNQFSRLVAANQDIRLFGEGEELRDHIWVDDVALIAWMMIIHKSVGSINAATGEVLSFNDIALTIINSKKAKTKVMSQPRKGEMPHNGYRPFDTSSLKNAFPQLTLKSFREIVKLL
jgi:UDP-glucose 4-epimerase